MEISESFAILKNNDFQPVSIDMVPRLKVDPDIRNGDDEGCRNGDAFTACCIACAAVTVTVWAYPACAMFCYLAFCK